MDGSRTAKMSETSQRSWVVVRAAHDLWRTLRDDCRAIPRHAWWRWGTTLVIGFVMCCALSFFIARFTRERAEHGLQSWDERQIVWFAEKGPISFQNAPPEFIPAELRNENDLNIFRWVNNVWTDKKL